MRWVDRTLVEIATRWMSMALMVACLSIGIAADVEPQPSLEQPGEDKAFLSVFINEPGFGKDPFFPNSKRREPKVVEPTPIKTPTEMNPNEVIEGLELKGISLGANKNLAIINNYTFAEGEERNVKVGNHVVEVRCIRIQHRSVSVIVNGRTRKELTLRDGL